MNRADALRNARNSYVVSWAKFQKLYSANPSSLFCFFEGEDVKYYSVRIDLVVRPANRVNLNCGGKDGVLRLRMLIRGVDSYANAWLAFFVDADFDDNSAIVSDDLYVTPCYSIENLYVTRSAFQRIIRDEVLTHQVENENDDIAALLHLYEVGTTSFLDAVESLNAWIKFTRSQPHGAKLRLNEVGLDKLVSVSPSGSRSLYRYVTLHVLYGIEVEWDESVIESVRESFPKGMARVHAFRGKYLLTFFERFLRHVLAAITEKPPQYVSSKCLPKLTLQSGNLLSQLSQYADTPDCLVSFLTTTRDRRPATNPDSMPISNRLSG